MIGKGKRPSDFNQLAKLIVDVSTGQAEIPALDKIKNPAAISRGRAGGIKGGRARSERLTKEQRKDIAKKGATARWNRKISDS